MVPWVSSYIFSPDCKIQTQVDIYVYLVHIFIDPFLVLIAKRKTIREYWHFVLGYKNQPWNVCECNLGMQCTRYLLYSKIFMKGKRSWQNYKITDIRIKKILLFLYLRTVSPLKIAGVAEAIYQNVRYMY